MYIFYAGAARKFLPGILLSTYVLKYNLFSNRLTKRMVLTDLLAKSELLFLKYCQRSVLDCFQMVELPSSSPIESEGK